MIIVIAPRHAAAFLAGAAGLTVAACAPGEQAQPAETTPAKTTPTAKTATKAATKPSAQAIVGDVLDFQLDAGGRWDAPSAR